MRGRKPVGPEFVERLAGSDKAKERARVLLEMMTGTCRVPEACERLGVKEARLDQIRIAGLQALVTELEDKPVGRPAPTPTPAELENEQLRARIARVEVERDTAQLRVEMGVGLPRVGAASKKNASAAPTPALSNPIEETMPGSSSPGEGNIEETVPGSSSPSEGDIVEHLKKLISTESIAEGPPRGGFAGQRVARENDHLVRRHVVDVGQRLFERGHTWTDTANLLSLPARTLRDWRLGFTTEPLRILPLGRPAVLASPETCQVVIRRIEELGPGIGVPNLRVEFPGLPRAEVADILSSVRQVWRWQHRQQLQQLHWSTPGSVWAIDHHDHRGQAIDGRCHYLLAVRDLASGQVLLWLPVTDATAHTAVEALEMLFIVHGAPLVLKSDNGPAFIAAPLRKLCRRFGVKNLYSPPYTPSYNGSIEATIGSLKIRTERYAARDGRPGLWTNADAQAAQREANTTARPHGPNGPSPDQVWTTRPTITQAQRDTFLRTVAHCFKELVAAQGPPEDHAHRRAMDREAISPALVELGYLSITRGRFRLPVCRKKVAEMT